MILLATPPKHSSATLLTKTASDWLVQYNNQYFELPQNFLHSPGLQLEINKVVCDQFLPSANSSPEIWFLKIRVPSPAACSQLPTNWLPPGPECLLSAGERPLPKLSTLLPQLLRPDSHPQDLFYFFPVEPGNIGFRHVWQILHEILTHSPSSSPSRRTASPCLPISNFSCLALSYLFY